MPVRFALLPHDALLRSTLGNVLLALLTAALAAVGLEQALGLGPAYAIKVLVVLGAGTAWLIGSIGFQHPFPTFGPANQVTLFRAGLVALLAGLIGEGSSVILGWLAIALAALGLALDGLDGWLARRSGMESKFGARFDLETDALLVLLIAAMAWQLGKAGAWILAAGLLRYAFAAAGRVWPWLARPLAPSFRRKCVCVLYLAAMITVVAPIVPAARSAIIAGAALLALCASFATDTVGLYRSRQRAQ